MRIRLKSYYYFSLAAKRNNLNFSRGGMTVMEILVSVVILTLASTAFLRVLTMGGRVQTHTTRLSRAVILASSEAERIKTHWGESAPIADTAYEVEFGKSVLVVERGRVADDDFGEPDMNREETEIFISVRQKGNDSAMVSFRLLHPFTEALE